MNKTTITAMLIAGTMLYPSVAFAEEVVEEAPPAEEVSSPEPAPEPTPEPEPAPEPEYVPPPEAFEGEGGWAVVDPKTGNVHGVTVCTASVCGPDGAWGGKMPVEYMGCTDCVLRFQTRAQESGNVVGVHSHGETEVKWNGNNSNSFSYSTGSDNNRTSGTLVPEKTMLDGNSIDTGVVNKKTTSTLENGVKIDRTQEDYLDKDLETSVLLPDWNGNSKLFSYGSEISAFESIESDVNEELVVDGFVTTDEETQETVIDEESPIVQTIRSLTESVLDFFRGLFS